MKRLSYKTILLYFLIAGALFSACRKEEVPEPAPNEVNLFVWNGLNDYYLWNDKVPDLSSEKPKNEKSFYSFLNQYSDPEELFNSLLYKQGEVDRWSFIVDDSKIIDDWISGTSKTMGYDFMLGKIGNSNNLFGFVRYIYKGSPAEKAGLKRGDIFMKVNSQQLTVSNYQKLLFDTETYTLGFAVITGNKIEPTDKTMTMTAIEMQENPINKDTIFMANNQKIGYLVYNGFNAEFDIELNEVIKKFKDANIDRMVLDLRYNGGGSVQSSIYLASMIYAADETKIFAKAQYNSGLQKYFVDEFGALALNDYFASSIAKTDKTPETPIVSLNLKKIHIIVSDNTASASEMLINGLRPYMNVRVIGINTVGKYTGSMTVQDWDEDGKVNPDHKWAMQPIVVKYSNSAGVTDYIDGLIPDIVAEEDFANLLPFGNPKEKLLSVALADMTGAQIIAKTLKSAQMGLEKVADTRDFKPLANEMYINPEKFIKRK